MFTGLIEAICTVKSVNQRAGGKRLAVDLGHLADEVKIGDSIAINGVCLTVAELNNNFASFDISPETLAKSTLGKITPASAVNAELALKSTERFGGHFVLGHIDGVARIKAIDRRVEFADMKFEADRDLLDQMIVKGSIAVEGVSLTIADMNRNSFSVALIPQTLEKTTLGKAKVGDMVNIETDVIVKTVRKQLEKIMPRQEKLTVEKLKELGF
ncbi:MAG: riboflavin synthase [Planctomycetota bacterium]|jgi:riboflavin synthase